MGEGGREKRGDNKVTTRGQRIGRNKTKLDLMVDLMVNLMVDLMIDLTVDLIVDL